MSLPDVGTVMKPGQAHYLPTSCWASTTSIYKWGPVTVPACTQMSLGTRRNGHKPVEKHRTWINLDDLRIREALLKPANDARCNGELHA